ncbi:hypothetical protein GCM10027093_59640 [Paraburkholderia jirisanensis]
MNFYARRSVIAWLGIFAMCLIVFAPAVSQWMVSVRAGEPVAALCTVSQTGGADHHTVGDLLSACGYCDLLAAHAAPPPIPPSIAPVLLLPIVAAVTVLSTRFTPVGAFPTGRPRAPPALS